MSPREEAAIDCLLELWLQIQSKDDPDLLYLLFDQVQFFLQVVRPNTFCHCSCPQTHSIEFTCTVISEVLVMGEGYCQICARHVDFNQEIEV